MQKFHYLLPNCPDFREQRPRLCWEHMYGWIDGYGVLFDPVIQHAIRTIPEWHLGSVETIGSDDMVITACQQASALLGERGHCGIFIRPSTGDFIDRAEVPSEKEPLLSPAGELYYPSGLPFDRYHGDNQRWRLGEAPAVAVEDRCAAVGFELFSMLASFLNEWPQRRLILGADMVHMLLCDIGLMSQGDEPARSDVQQEMRLDFQAYGVNRLLVQWLADLHGQPRTVVTEGDLHYREAVDAWRDDNAQAACAALARAFTAMAEARRTMSSLELRFIEVPHMGILLEEKGFFELEWPAFARQTLLEYLDHATQHGYRLSLEAGAHCWRNLALRYPRLIERIGAAWGRGEISLTNGTYSLPYALQSPLTLQYMQLCRGRDVFEQVFGRAPQTYQCQENSLTAQMPELLRHFGYELALHLTQNRGHAPNEPTNGILWQSHAGCGIPALTTRDKSLSHKGNNFYLDLPLIHYQFADEAESINYFNFQDLGFMPLREQMIRAHHYAPVWGVFATPESGYAAETPSPCVTPRTYDADAYDFSAAGFYSDSTNANALSHGELIMTLTSRWRQAQLAAFGSSHWDRVQHGLGDAVESLCVLEAHDAVVVQNQRRGEFFASMTMAPPPYHRDTLREGLRCHVQLVENAIGEAQRAIKGDRLLNASGATLPVARINGDGAPLAGPFAPWSLCDAPQAIAKATPVELPITTGFWHVTTTENMLVVTCLQQTLRIAMVDQPLGGFSLTSAVARQSGSLVILQTRWTVDAVPAQSVVMEAVINPAHQFMELNLQYAPGRSFDSSRRWKNHLALEVSFGTSLQEVQRFNPNVQSATAEHRTISPWYLATRSNDKWISLLNQGAGAYELNRAEGSVRWLFHVADETIWRRSMAVAFGSRDAFELARGWTQGLIPAAAAPPLPVLPPSVAIEAFVDGTNLLISNLRREPARFDLDAASVIDVRTMAGNSAIAARNGGVVTVELGACELALILPNSMNLA